MTTDAEPGIALPLPGCRICGGLTRRFGEKPGNTVARLFHFSRCQNCNFISVIDPHLDFAQLYNEDYYRGQGADPYVDYYFELEHPQRTIRQYEWRGIYTAVKRIAGEGISRWLDYGCGNGGLVRYLREQSVDAVGFDEGAIVSVARAKGIPILTGPELEAEAGRFSVVTMIEVIEHVPDPISLLHKVRSLLKRGGILFLTTGNSAPQRGQFVNWGYVVPDIHVSYFDPHNMQMALETTGFKPEFPSHPAGWDDIIRFKVLKTLRWREVSLLEQLIPWKIASPLIDRRTKLSNHPIGRTGSSADIPRQASLAL